jgi:ubiquinone biosynthesis monooxygenase Coq7
MQSSHPLDHFIAAADRALRALFAPAHASRPIPGDLAAADKSASAKPASSEATPGQQPSAAASVHAASQHSSIAAVSGATPDDKGSAYIASVDATNSSASASATPANPTLSDVERRESAALMRINHAGEIAAQALYHGQALMARSVATRNVLLRAAEDESDHLAWCETRLKELGSRPSLLNPLWYFGSFAIGVAAAVTGDRTSLGFVVETERQVEGHLDEHLVRLPTGDTRSRAILNQMRTDEIGHGATAKAAGGVELPAPVRALMRHTARVMTAATYWI